MMASPVFIGAQVFDGTRLLDGRVVAVEDGRPLILPGDTSHDAHMIALDGGIFLPGFVDLQVNGGGGVMFNDAPDLTTLATIARAHARLGTCGFLPTLITDTPAQTTAAIAAVKAATAAGLRGILGLHLEGPHLSVARKGAHDATLIRPMTEADCAELIAAAQTLPNLMITVAPESVTIAQINALSAAGAIIFLGHSDCDCETAAAAFAAGAKGSTHLFNAMSPLAGRAPGLVGASLNTAGASCGLIADGIHVHPSAIRTALAAKTGPGAIFLVTDAMACAGSDISHFTLNGRKIIRDAGRLTLEDGTLAGADLDMAQALRVMINDVGDLPENAIARATSIPASLLRMPQGAGRWPEHVDDLIYLTPDFRVKTLAELS